MDETGPDFTEWSKPERKTPIQYTNVYIMRYYSAIKKNEIMPFTATWVDLENIILSEVSQIKTNIIWYHLYVESKKWYKWTYL